MVPLSTSEQTYKAIWSVGVKFTRKLVDCTNCPLFCTLILTLCTNFPPIWFSSCFGYRYFKCSTPEINSCTCSGTGTVTNSILAFLQALGKKYSYPTGLYVVSSYAMPLSWYTWYWYYRYVVNGYFSSLFW
jgi:hypothetical protein